MLYISTFCDGIGRWCLKYWVGQKVHSRFSIRCYRKTQTNLLANPVSSVQFTCSVMSNSLQPLGLQHARLPCPSPTPGACSNSCPLGWWCHPTMSFSVVPFSSSLKSFPASRSFPMSQFFASGGQSIGVSASASVLPLTGLISLQSKELSRVFSNTFLYGPTLTSIHDYWKNCSLDQKDLWLDGPLLAK